MSMSYLKRTCIAILLAFSIVGCKKLVEVDVPVTKVSEKSVFASDVTASAYITGIYTELSGTTLASTGFMSLSRLAGLSADEFTLYSAVTNITPVSYYKNKLSTVPSVGSEIWNDLYKYIYRINSAIIGLQNATELTPVVKQQLQGEAKFLRAFFNFYLVNLYGDIPLPLGIDYEVNRLLPRSSKADVYKQIVTDLLESKSLLSQDYLESSLLKKTTERVRPTKAAASALLARAYLYMGDWNNAEAQSTEIINQTQTYKLSTLANTFLKNSDEAIWQLQPVISGYNTQDAIMFIIPTTGPNVNTNYVYLSKTLVNGFESGDNRRTTWVDSVKVSNVAYYYPTKYKLSTQNSSITSASGIGEYVMILRLAEQYLIRSEARAQTGNLSGAIDDLNSIRRRARSAATLTDPNPLPDLSSGLSKDQVLTAIARERKNELFTEWGHRWLDIKRTNVVDDVMTQAAIEKGSTWEPYQQLYPILPDDILKDANLTQNLGYQ